MTPQHLSRTEFAGLLRVGDVLIPGDQAFPSFSASKCGAHADRMLMYMTESDRRGLKILLRVFRFAPRFAVRGILYLTESHGVFPQPIAAALRLTGLGAKGLVMTLYYSDLDGSGKIHNLLKWDAKVDDRARSSDHPEAPPPNGAEQPASTVATASTRPAVLPFERARRGALSLRHLTVAERLRYLGNLRATILNRREEIIDRIQQDTGKARSDALISEIFGALDNLAWLEKYAPTALKDRKQHTPIVLMGKKSQTWYEPLGAILIIAPWNYPFYQAIVPIACAFAAGNTVVYKPSEWTPLSGLVEDLLGEAQFAPNWVCVVYGNGAVGAELIDQRPEKIFFTGSTQTGRTILAQAASHLIPVELELGGKDAMIVFDDVNVQRAAAGAAWGALTTTGQSFTSVERLYVHESVYVPFKAAVVREVARLKQAIDVDGDADIGAMTTDFQVQIVARHVEDAISKGATVLTGTGWDRSSKLIPPMVIDRVTDDMLLARDETFGPIIPLLSFRTEEEVIRRTNESPYGLTASVWTSDAERATRVSRALEVGGVDQQCDGHRGESRIAVWRHLKQRHGTLQRRALDCTVFATSSRCLSTRTAQRSRRTGIRTRPRSIGCSRR